MAQNLFSRRRQTKRKQKNKRHNSEFFDEGVDASVLRECEVVSLSHEGRGIAKYKGKTQFIEGALLGELVKAKLLNSHNTYDELRMVEVIKSSPDRIEPFCKHFDICGGCSLQNMTTEAQLVHKEEVLNEQLSHFGQIKAKYRLEPIRSPNKAYRSKARLGVYFDSNLSKTVIGFREKQSKRLTDIEECPILCTSIGKLLQPLRKLIQSLQSVNSVTHIELAVGDDEPAVVIRHVKDLSAEDRQALERFSKEQNLKLFLQGNADAEAQGIMKNNNELEYSLHTSNDINAKSSVKFRFHPQDFTQVNAEVNRSLVALALEELQLKKTDRVLDLFCGLGNFTLPIALKCTQVLGVEGVDDMVARAARNAQLNEIENANFVSADLHKDFRNKPWAKQSFDKILLDPPRSGALVVVNYLHHFNPQRIVYISCNPATLARDAGVLASHGYRLEKSGVIDMFPNTAHIESIAVFVR